jgi:hypothetical protein
MTPANRTRAASPCPHKAGSPERLRTLELRYALGLPLHVPGDNTEQVPIQGDGGKPSQFVPRVFREPKP